ncbi:hypothetical protein EC988_005061, partial [Linderina pennispora]
MSYITNTTDSASIANTEVTVVPSTTNNSSKPLDASQGGSAEDALAYLLGSVPASGTLGQPSV